MFLCFWKYYESCSTRFVLKRISKFSIFIYCKYGAKGKFWLTAQCWKVVWLVGSSPESSEELICDQTKVQSCFFFFLIYRSFVLFKCNVALRHLTNPQLKRTLCLSVCLPVFFVCLFFVFCWTCFVLPSTSTWMEELAFPLFTDCDGDINGNRCKRSFCILLLLLLLILAVKKFVFIVYKC